MLLTIREGKDVAKILYFNQLMKDAETNREAHDVIMSLAVIPSVEDIVKTAWLNPAAFVLNKNSKQEFYDRRIYDAEEDGFVYCPDYDWINNDTIYRVQTIISWIDGNEFEIESTLYRLESYRDPESQWMVFAPDNGWQEGPGAGFFAIESFDGV